MSRFKKKKGGGQPAINTSALPDIIFMLLFFFMVTTVMREVTLKVRVKAPTASEVQKLEKKSLVDFIYIGEPQNKKLGTEPRIQLSDAFAEVKEIQQFVESCRAAKEESKRKLLTFSLKVDEDARMGIVTDVKQELRKANALKISYSTKKGDPNARQF